MLGAAGEELGYDRHLKPNTTKRRTQSLSRQGSMFGQLIPNMTDFLLLPLIKRFAAAPQKASDHAAQMLIAYHPHRPGAPQGGLTVASVRPGGPDGTVRPP
jgi:hypothetical protein